MRVLSLCCLIAIVFASSCTTQKTVTNNYLYNVNDTSGKDLITPAQLQIKKGDQLSIRVYSIANGSDPKIDAPYNLVEQSASSNNIATQGFLVNQNGDIDYPQIGTIHAEGLTRDQLADLIKIKFSAQLTQASVVVRFLNYTISVLGEVRAPGRFTVSSDRITILEALGIAGDITEFGRKDNVKIIRENNGQRAFATLDLTSKDFFNSPFYRLQQNDVVLVEQTRRKIRQQDQQVLLQQLGLFTSIVGAAALILNIIK